MVQKFSIDQALDRAKMHTEKGEMEQAHHIHQSVIAAFPNNNPTMQAWSALNPVMVGALKLNQLKEQVDH